MGGITISRNVQAGCLPSCPCASCCNKVGPASKGCTHVSTNQTGIPSDSSTTIGHITQEFNDHREWMVNEFLKGKEKGTPLGVFKALQLMTIELTSIGMQYVNAVGMYFDAAHQLETQRLFQVLTAQAHKDYQPSEELCDFGSSTKSLAPSRKIADLTSVALTTHSLDRQLLAKNSIAHDGIESDDPIRLVSFIKNFCDKKDDGGNLSLLCTKSENKKLLFNRDIDFTRSISAPLTLDVDLTTTDSTPTDDEQSLFALMDNLFSHEILPQINQNKLVTTDDTKLSVAGYEAILDQRALTAKRSVAINSIASIAALKSKGDSGTQPFLYAIIKEMGGSAMAKAEIEELLGEEPSYHAQMEVLTKLIYQNPNFYTDLLDKPTNVARKEVALQAADLMQKRDTYRSLLRSEAVIATMLETALMEEQDFVLNKLNAAAKDTGRGAKR